MGLHLCQEQQPACAFDESEALDEIRDPGGVGVGYGAQVNMRLRCRPTARGSPIPPTRRVSARYMWNGFLISGTGSRSQRAGVGPLCSPVPTKNLVLIMYIRDY